MRSGISNSFSFLLIVFCTTFSFCSSHEQKENILFNFKLGMPQKEYRDIITTNIRNGVFKQENTNYEHFDAILKLPNISLPIGVWLNSQDGRKELDHLEDINIEIGDDIYKPNIFDHSIKLLTKYQGPTKRIKVDSIKSGLVSLYGVPDIIVEKYANSCSGFLITSIYGGDPNNPLTIQELKKKGVNDNDIKDYFTEIAELKKNINISKDYSWTKIEGIQISLKTQTCLFDTLNFNDVQIKITKR